jgi:hypothetical protein
MNEDYLRKILIDFKEGRINIERIIERLKTLPYEDIGFANIDTHRELRKGTPEVIMGEWKSSLQIIHIIRKMLERGGNIFVTRVDSEKGERLSNEFPDGMYDPLSRTFRIVNHEIEVFNNGYILVLSGGTSDIPVAEESAIAAEFMGNVVKRIYDVGVAGIHRLFAHIDELMNANIIVVVAGMEGALPSVVGGFVSKPVIGVPTSIGYGTSFGGISALLSMLNSCASNVAVVNIDNGFGAGYIASLINRVGIK